MVPLGFDNEVLFECVRRSDIDFFANISTQAGVADVNLLDGPVMSAW